MFINSSIPLFEGTETTNSEATRAQGDDNIEDTENTEHDISGAGESLEPTSEAHPNEVTGKKSNMEFLYVCI